MENFLLILVGIGAAAIVLFISYLIFKGLWIAVKGISGNLPDFLGKVFTGLITAFCAGLIGNIIFDLPFNVSGGVALAGAAISAMRS